MFFNNPVLRRELLDRLRSWKTFAALIAVAIVSSGLVLLIGRRSCCWKCA